MKRNACHTFLSKAIGILFTVVLIFFFNEGISQSTTQTDYNPGNNSNPSISIEGRLFYGFINNYHNELKIFNTHVPAFEIGLLQITSLKNKWAAGYHFPRIGLSLFYTPFNNSKALGKAFGLYPHINFPLLQTSKQSINFRMGMGLAYFTSKFEPRENYQNLAIGSSLNALIHFMFDYQWHLNKKNNLSMSLGLIHFSNGSITTPNYGLNLPMASIAYSHSFNEDIQKRSTQTYPLFRYEKNKDFRLDYQMGYGIKRMNKIPSDKFQIFTQSLTLFKPLNNKSDIGAGLDFSWDESHKTLLSDEGINPPSGLGLAKYALAANYELKLDKLAFKVGLGTYVYAKEKAEGTVYEKLALNYLFYKNLYCSIELKAHAAKAAYIGWGIGYQFNFKMGKP